MRRLNVLRRLFSSAAKDDHFNQFGPPLKTNVYPSKRQVGSKLDHFNEFGPVIKSGKLKTKIGTKSTSTSKSVFQDKTNRVLHELDDNYDGPTIKPGKLKTETELFPTKSQPKESNTVSEYVISDPPLSPPSKPTLPLISSATRAESVAPEEGEVRAVLRLPFQYRAEWPSVSRILRDTMSEQSKAVLARWEAEKIALLGAEGFKQYKADMFRRGKTLHSMLETFLETRSLPTPADIEDDVSKRHLVSISQLVRCVDRPLALESAVTHADLGYSGIVDCVAVINNTVTLIDWKTSEKVKNSAAALYDNPLQLAAYIGAINTDPRYEGLGSISHGAVVTIYNSGYPAMLHTFDQDQLSGYWSQWCKRLEIFKNLPRNI